MSAVREESAARPQHLNSDRHLLVSSLKDVVGDKHVLTDDRATRRYRTGFRFGEGKALAVVQPGTVVEQWKVLKRALRQT
jgi:D-lactate dehydrogenase